MWSTRKIERHGVEVVENIAMDALRKTQCLCLNCARLESCPIAAEGLRLCQTYHVAFAITRCPEWQQK